MFGWLKTSMVALIAGGATMPDLSGVARDVEAVSGYTAKMTVSGLLFTIAAIAISMAVYAMHRWVNGTEHFREEYERLAERSIKAMELDEEHHRQQVEAMKRVNETLSKLAERVEVHSKVLEMLVQSGMAAHR